MNKEIYFKKKSTAKGRQCCLAQDGFFFFLKKGLFDK